jgi:hypothetical protein
MCLGSTQEAVGPVGLQKLAIHALQSVGEDGSSMDNTPPTAASFGGSRQIQQIKQIKVDERPKDERCGCGTVDVDSCG